MDNRFFALIVAGFLVFTGMFFIPTQEAKAAEAVEGASLVAELKVPFDQLRETSTFEVIGDVVLVTNSDGSTETIPRELYPKGLTSTQEWGKFWLPSGSTVQYLGECWTKTVVEGNFLYTCDQEAGKCSIQVNWVQNEVLCTYVMDWDCGEGAQSFVTDVLGILVIYTTQQPTTATLSCP